MARTGRIVATFAAGPIEPQPNPTAAEADARITDAEVDGLYAPRTRAEARQRRLEVEAARLIDYGDDDDAFEELLRKTVFNYPNGDG